MATLVEVPAPVRQVRRSTARQRIFKLHMYCGVAASAFVFVLAVTGALLAFKDPIDRALNPKLSYVQPQAQRVAMSQIVQNLQARYPEYTVLGLGLPEKPEYAMVAELRRGEAILGVAVDPYTGAILGDTENSNHFMDRVQWLHKNLVLGEGLTKLVAFLLLLLAVSGVVLWMRRRKLSVSARAAAHVVALDLHSMVGIYAAVFVIIFAFTGLRPIPAGLFMKRGGRVVTAADVANQKIERARFTPEELLAKAQAAVPGATPTWVDASFSSLKGALIVGFRYPEDHSDGGRTHVAIDAVDGHIRAVSGPRTLSAMARFVLFTDMEIHTGVIWGNASRVIAALSALAMAVLAITGPLIWWRKRSS